MAYQQRWRSSAAVSRMTSFSRPFCQYHQDLSPQHHSDMLSRKQQERQEAANNACISADRFFLEQDNAGVHDKPSFFIFTSPCFGWINSDDPQKTARRPVDSGQTTQTMRSSVPRSETPIETPWECSRLWEIVQSQSPLVLTSPLFVIAPYKPCTFA